MAESTFDKLNLSTKKIIRYIIVPLCIIGAGVPLYSYQKSNYVVKTDTVANVLPENAASIPDANEQGTETLTKDKIDAQRNENEVTDADKNAFDLGDNSTSNVAKTPIKSTNNVPPNDNLKSKATTDYYNRNSTLKQSNQRSKVYYDSPDREGITYWDSKKVQQMKDDETILNLRKRLNELEGKNSPDSTKPKEEPVIMPRYIGQPNLNQTYVANNTLDANNNQRFYSATNNRIDTKKSKNTKKTVVMGEIMETKTVKQQSSIKIKLLENFSKDGLFIESGTYLTGLCIFSGADRVEIKLNSIVVNSSLVAIKGDILDLDGNVGIQIPNLQANAVRSTALSRITSGASSSASPMFFLNAQGGIGQQVAGQVIGSTAGNVINTGQNILMNKLAEFKANLSTGHKVYINITEINY